MNKAYIILTLFLLSLNSVAQKQKATLFFTNGTSIKGYAKIKGSDEIKFKITKNSDKKIYDYTTVSKITIRNNDDDVTYFYKTIKNKKKPILLEVLEIGEITLYRDLTQGYSAGMPIAGSAGMTFGGGSYTISSYYVERKNDNIIYHLGDKGNLFSKNFKKAAIEYFKDCTSLVKKIENKELKKKDVIEIVEFYNENCGKSTKKEEVKIKSTDTQT